MSHQPPKGSSVKPTQVVSLKTKILRILQTCYQHIDLLKQDPSEGEQALRTMITLFFEHHEQASSSNGILLLTSIDVYFDLVKELTHLNSLQEATIIAQNPQQKDDDLQNKIDKVTNYLKGCKVIFINVINYDVCMLPEEDQIKVFQKVKDKILNRVENIEMTEHLGKIMEAIFQAEEVEDDDGFNSLTGSENDSDSSSSSSSSKSDKVKSKTAKDLKISKKSEKQKEDDEKSDEDDADDFLKVSKALFGENQSQYLESLLLNRDWSQVQNLKEQTEIIMTLYALSETIINMKTSKEYGFQFFKTHYKSLNKILSDIQNLLTQNIYQSLPKQQQDFLAIFADSLSYIYLDYMINESDLDQSQDGSDQQSIDKDDAKETLIIATNLFKYLMDNETTISKKFYVFMTQTSCKLITYIGAYLSQDEKVDFSAQILEGLKLIQQLTTNLLKPYRDSGLRASLNKDQRGLIFSLYDSLNQIFSLVEYQIVEPIVNQELFDNLLTLFSLDEKEHEMYLKCEENNEFFQLQCGANRKYYKEFAYAFVNDIIRHKKAQITFLMYCVSTFKVNRDGTVAEQEKAAAALFILALCESELLENEKNHISNFAKKELIPLVLDKSNLKLLRFRAIWILETFVSFLDKSDLITIMKFYSKSLDQTSIDHESSDLIRSAIILAIFQYMIQLDQNFLEEDKEFTPELLFEYIGFTPSQLLTLFTNYTCKYPELLEFPNGIQNLMTIFQKNLDIKDPQVVKQTLDALVKGFNVVVCKATFLEDRGQTSEDFEEYCEYMMTIGSFVYKALEIALPDQTGLVKEDLKDFIKKQFKLFLMAAHHNPGQQQQNAIKAFYVFFSATKTEFQIQKFKIKQQEEDSSESDLEDEEEEKSSTIQQIDTNAVANQSQQFSDKELLRIILMNSLYSYRNKDQIRNMNTKIIKKPDENDDQKEKNKDDSFDELEIKVQDTLKELDANCLSLHFVLYQIKGDIELLFENESGFKDPEQEVRNCYKAIYLMMKLFTQYLSEQAELNLRNYISYWLVMSNLIENDKINDIDEEFMNMLEDDQDLKDDGAAPEAPYFLFEKSLELLRLYLFKLTKWYNPTIYLFYLYMMCLYYSYQEDKTYEEISKIGEQNKESNKVFSQNFKFDFENNSNIIDNSLILKSFNTFTRGQVWLISGLIKLMKYDATKALTKDFIVANLSSLSIIGRGLVSNFFQKQQEAQDSFQQGQPLLKMKANLLQTLADLPEDYGYDDVLHQGLQQFFMSYDSQIAPSTLLSDFIDFYETIKDYPSSTTNNLAVQDIQIVKKGYEDIIKEMKQIQSMNIQESNESYKEEQQIEDEDDD